MLGVTPNYATSMFCLLNARYRNYHHRPKARSALHKAMPHPLLPHNPFLYAQKVTSDFTKQQSAFISKERYNFQTVFP